MKYFTKEELEDITKELIENPTRETLKNLNEKYNGAAVEQELSQVKIESPVVTPVPTMIVEEHPVVTMPNEVVEEKTVMPAMDIALPPVVETPVVAPTVSQVPVELPTPGIGIPNFQPPVIGTVSNTVEATMQVPTFELPKLEEPTFNNQNNAPVNFSGNLFDMPMQEPANLMQTTDNFNVAQSIMPSTEVPVTPAPFFISSPADVNNPIPVGGPLNSMPVNEPTMFGQIEQNYM